MQLGPVTQPNSQASLRRRQEAMSERQMELGFIPEPRDAYLAQLVEGSDERLEPYILVPQAKAEDGEGSAADRLRRLNIVVGEQIPLIGGFTAVLNRAARVAAEKAGFKAIPDTNGNFVPEDPWEDKKDRRDQVANAMAPRQELTQPRFISPLTQTYTGKGVGIAVIDTGIYPHPDFNYPQSRITVFKDFVNGKTLPYDDNGHGTHVAGGAAGSGFLSRGLHRGTAPDADLIGIKVLDENGTGSRSRILAGLNWAVENRARYNIRVVNLSLGSGAPATYSEDDPLRQAVEKAVDSGMVVVVSAGNRGPYPGTLTSPADSPKVITVGAVDDRNTPSNLDDYVPGFSSRGQVGESKPDLLAPGESVVGPNAPNSRLETRANAYTDVHKTLQWLRNMPDEQLVNVPTATLKMIGLNGNSIRRFQADSSMARSELESLIARTARMPLVDNDYIGMPGTSAAAPLVAGVAAQMLEANPDLTPAEVKEILKESAIKLPFEPGHSQGAGVVNPDRAIALALQRVGEPEPDGQLRLPWGTPLN